MIEDDELRNIFGIECSEHIQMLSEGLLRLEKDPKDSATLEEVFREAHSLKGAARMVGASNVETIAHKFEDIIGAAKGGKTVLTSDVIDRLYKGLDSIHRFVNEAVTGEKAGIIIADVISQIDGSPVHKPTSVRSEQEWSMGNITHPLIAEGKGEADDVLSSSPSEFRIGTVRVDTRILDMLITQAGELAVTKLSIARHIAEMEDFITTLEEVEKKRPEFSSWSPEFRNRIQNLKSMMGKDSARLNFVAGKIEEGIGKTRLVPLSAIFNLFPSMVRNMARDKGKDINLIIEGGDVTADKRIIEEMKDPVMHMVRNSIDHGIEGPEERKRLGKPGTGIIHLNACQTGSNIFIEVSDDGKGLDIDAIRETAIKRNLCTEEELAKMTPSQIETLIFSTGFSTSPFVTEVSGRGIGLDVVRKNAEHLKGTVCLETSPGAGCKVMIKLPLTLATIRVLIVEVDGRKYAVPVEYVDTSLFLFKEDIFPVAGMKTISIEGQPVSVANLAEVLEIPGTQWGRETRNVPPSTATEDSSKNGKIPCIILSISKERIGLLVDALVDEQEVVLKPHSLVLKQIRNVSGATILATGEVCMVLNPGDLLKSVRDIKAPAQPEVIVKKANKKKEILLVEDSITTRTQEKRILEGAGYDVVTAVDGRDAFSKLYSRPFDAVVSDILMPNMDGLTLTGKIRQDKRFNELPVILVTTLASNEDRKRGLEAGANAYIEKPAFDQKTLLEILERLV